MIRSLFPTLSTLARIVRCGLLSRYTGPDSAASVRPKKIASSDKIFSGEVSIYNGKQAASERVYVILYPHAGSVREVTMDPWQYEVRFSDERYRLYRTVFDHWDALWMTLTERWR